MDPLQKAKEPKSEKKQQQKTIAQDHKSSYQQISNRIKAGEVGGSLIDYLPYKFQDQSTGA